MSNRPLSAGTFGIIFWIVLCNAVGIAGALATMDAVPSWYAGLKKPAYTPPDWLFGPAWTTLYTLMGIAAWRIWRQADTTLLRRLFIVQLVVNGIWTPVFFGLKLTLFGLAIILILDCLVGALIWFAFRRGRPLAGTLLLPYLGWILFATYLNAGIWWLN